MVKAAVGCGISLEQSSGEGQRELSIPARSSQTGLRTGFQSFVLLLQPGDASSWSCGRCAEHQSARQARSNQAIAAIQQQAAPPDEISSGETARREQTRVCFSAGWKSPAKISVTLSRPQEELSPLPLCFSGSGLRRVTAL